MFAIVKQWPGLYRELRVRHRSWMRELPKKERHRVRKSAVRTASFLYMLSLVTDVPFDRQNAVLAGILAAVFDDLYDHRLESNSTIRDLIDVKSSQCQSNYGTIFEQRYAELRDRLEPWQQGQLQQVLHGLSDCEEQVLDGEDVPSHWAIRGTKAFQVYLTLGSIPEDCWVEAPMLVFGEYLQAMDDYEDVDEDDDEINYFGVNPMTDIDGHFMSIVQPAMEQMIDVPKDASFDWNFDLFSECIESYHAFQVDIFRRKHEKKRKKESLAGKVGTENGQPVSGDRRVEVVLPEFGGQQASTQDTALHQNGVGRVAYAFSRSWNVGLPNRMRLWMTRVVIRLFSRFMPF